MQLNNSGSINGNRILKSNARANIAWSNGNFLSICWTKLMCRDQNEITVYLVLINLMLKHHERRWLSFNTHDYFEVSANSFHLSQRVKPKHTVQCWIEKKNSFIAANTFSQAKQIDSARFKTCKTWKMYFLILDVWELCARTFCLVCDFFFVKYFVSIDLPFIMI